jgi:hypothetical protein
VLQAVHLLLAFELFVVVVAVDVNWVAQALESEAAAREVAGSRGGVQDPKTEVGLAWSPMAYLEKIFQIVFWLRPLTVDSTTGGSYGQYVRELVAAKVAAKTDEPGADRGGAPAKTEAGPQTSGAVAHQEPATGGAPEGKPDARVDAEAITSLERKLATVQLDAEEVDFLASYEIGQLAAKSPRAVKRLVNVYRIVRSQIRDRKPQALTGEDGLPPSYPILVLLAAIETGQPVEVADAFYQGLLKSSGDTVVAAARSVDQSDAAVVDENAAADKNNVDGKTLLGRAFTKCPLLLPALEAAQRKRGGYVISAGECVALARDVRRYSFNRYQA